MFYYLKFVSFCSVLALILHSSVAQNENSCAPLKAPDVSVCVSSRSRDKIPGDPKSYKVVLGTVSSNYTKNLQQVGAQIFDALEKKLTEIGIPLDQVHYFIIERDGNEGNWRWISRSNSSTDTLHPYADNIKSYLPASKWTRASNFGSNPGCQGKIVEKYY